MRIALTTPFSWPEVRRGGERYAHELAAALQAAGHEVTVWSTARRPGRRRILGVPVRQLAERPQLAPRWGPQAVEVAFGRQVLGRLLTARIDVWHATGIGDGAAATIAGRLRPSLRTIFTDHGFPALASRSKRRDAGLQVRVTRHIDAYVCVSEAAGHYLHKDYGRRPDVVPPGVDVGSYQPAERDRRPTLMFSGQLDESRKNLPLLLEAVAELRCTDLPDLQLWLAGQGDAGPALAAAPRPARDAVTWCGPLEEVELRRRYAEAWVTVLPSVAESFGLAVVESLASGTPAVVRRDGGGPAGIITDPETGVQSGPAASDLASAIRQALPLASRPGTAAACRRAAEPYDWANVVTRLERIYAGS